MKPVAQIPEPRVKPPKYDYAAAAAAGATPLIIFLHKAHGYLAKAYLIWMVLFVLGIILYHSLGKPAWLIDNVVPVLAGPGSSSGSSRRPRSSAPTSLPARCTWPRSPAFSSTAS